MDASVATIPEVVEQYADNAASLWDRREHVAFSRTSAAKISDLARIDERLDSQIDGLRVSGEKACLAALEGSAPGTPGVWFTAAVLLFENGQAKGLNPLFDSIKKPLLALRPLSTALDWTNARSLPKLGKWTGEHSGPLMNVVTVTVLFLQCSLTPKYMEAALAAGEPVLFHAVCDLAVKSRQQTLRHSLEGYATQRGNALAVPAATAAVRLGSYRAVDVLAQIIRDGEPAHAEMATTTLFRALGPQAASSMHRNLFGVREPTRTSLLAAAAAGTRELIPYLIQAMDRPMLARLAGEAFSGVTGAEIIGELAATERASGYQGDTPSEDPADDNTDLSLDEGKPWPNGAAVEEWWHRHSIEFVPMTRYLAGFMASSEDWLRQLLYNNCKQTLRAAAAELLAVAGEPLFDVYAPAFRQAGRLGGTGPWQ